jgi:hypothetical protein
MKIPNVFGKVPIKSLAKSNYADLFFKGNFAKDWFEKI